MSAHAAGATHRATEQAYSAKACTPNGCEAAMVRVACYLSLRASRLIAKLQPYLLHGIGGGGLSFQAAMQLASRWSLVLSAF